MKRITVDEVVAAFEATGLHAKREAYLQGHVLDENERVDCACGLGAMFVYNRVQNGADANTIIEQYNNEIDDCDVTDELEKTYRPAYVCGFARGFDGRAEDKPHTYTGLPEFLAGREDGEAAWKAVQERLPSVTINGD